MQAQKGGIRLMPRLNPQNMSASAERSSGPFGTLECELSLILGSRHPYPNCSPSPSTPPAYTPPLRTRTPLPANNTAQRSVDDMENSTANVSSVGESDGASSLEEESSDDEDCELPLPAASSSFSFLQAIPFLPLIRKCQPSNHMRD
jgi:hypothetical protein